MKTKTKTITKSFKLGKRDSKMLTKCHDYLVVLRKRLEDENDAFARSYAREVEKAYTRLHNFTNKNS